MEFDITCLSVTCVVIAGLMMTFSPGLVGRKCCGGGCKDESLEAPPVLIDSWPLLPSDVADTTFTYMSCSSWTFGMKFVLLFGTSHLPFSSWLAVSTSESLHVGLFKGPANTPTSSSFLAFFFSGLLLMHLNITRQTPNTINTKRPAPAIQMTLLAITDFLVLAGTGAVRAEGPCAIFQGDSWGDEPIATGAGAAAGGDGIIVVLNGFPFLLHRTCYYVN